MEILVGTHFSFLQFVTDRLLTFARKILHAQLEAFNVFQIHTRMHEADNKYEMFMPLHRFSLEIPSDIVMPIGRWNIHYIKFEFAADKFVHSVVVG